MTSPEAQVLNPVMLRVYKDDKKGATAFFRNRPFLYKLLELTSKIDADQPEVLFHACSIGAEPYSFAATVYAMEKNVAISATDIVPDFVGAAQAGCYPKSISKNMQENEKVFFDDIGNDQIKLKDEIRERVNFLPAASLSDARDDEYDVVLAMNVLTYLTPEAQTKAIAEMASYARHYLCLTAFHPDQIQSDVEAIGFEPVEDDIEKIHNAWGDRIRPVMPEPGTPEYSWMVPKFNTETPDYKYRYCAIFKRIQE